MNANFFPTLFPDSHAPSEDEDFNVVGNEIYATFSPWASWLNDGNPFAPLAMPMLPAAVTGSGSTTSIDPGSAVAVTSGGITINLLYDAAALAAPASFRAGIQQAVSILAAAISDQITVNIKIDYSGSGHGAAAGPDHGLFQSYSSIRTNLIANATPGDTTFNALAAGSSIQGQSSVAVWNAQLKLWGLMGANDTTTDDGAATFATDIDPSLLVGVALHELTHAMGRIPYGPQPDIFDLFRFTGPGTRLFQGGATAPAAYFSLDGGNSKVADYGRTSDASDFLNSGVQGANDPFNEFYNGRTSQQLTATDLKQLDALGFHLNSGTPGSVVIGDASVAEGNSGTTVETFMVTRTGGTAAFDVSFSTAESSATVADHDYVASSGTLHFGAGVNTQTISITINGDTKPESDEAFLVNLSGATNGASVSDGQGIGTIANDDVIVASGLTSTFHDFNGDGFADISFRNNSTGDTGYTDIHNNVFHSLGGSPAAWSVAGSDDYNGDTFGDILFRNNSTGDTGYTDIHNNVFHSLGGSPAAWSVAGSGDYNGDTFGDILFRNNSTGDTGYTDIHNNVFHSLGGSLASWSVVGSGDYNGDNFSDILFRNNSTGDTGYTDIHNNVYHSLGGSPAAWSVVGSGDYNGDNFSDILFRNNSTGDTGYTDIHNNVFHSLGGSPAAWSVVASGDYNGDSFSDILFRNNSTGDTGYTDIHNNVFHSLGGSPAAYLVVA
jgi:hypothetical protein